MFRQESRQRGDPGESVVGFAPAIPSTLPRNPLPAASLVVSVIASSFYERFASQEYLCLFDRRKRKVVEITICNKLPIGAGRGLGVLQSAANLPIAMLAGGKHTLIPGRLEVKRISSISPCCGIRKKHRSLCLLAFFDRCHSLHSLHLPLAAVVSLPPSRFLWLLSCSAQESNINMT